MELTPGTVAACIATARESGATAIVVPERTVGSDFVAQCRALERRCYEGDPTIEAARFFVREAFTRHGGYDETLTGPEDWDLPARMKMSGEILGRASNALVKHDEGDLRLGDHLRKKYYYGKSFGAYVRRHSDLARAHLTPLRPVLVRNWRRLAAEPVLGIGVVVLKAAEFAAGGLGLASSALHRACRYHPRAVRVPDDQGDPAGVKGWVVCPLRADTTMIDASRGRRANTRSIASARGGSPSSKIEPRTAPMLKP